MGCEVIIGDADDEYNDECSKDYLSACASGNERCHEGQLKVLHIGSVLKDPSQSSVEVHK